LIDLLLINPPITYIGTFPLGPLSIASYVREHGFNVRIIDANSQDIRMPSVLRKARIIGVTATTERVISAYKVCEYVKKNVSPDIFCILGGIHATALPEKTLEESMFDMVVVGEGEQTMLEILQEPTGKTPVDIPGTAIKNGDSIIVNKPRELMKDLDTLPLPAYDLIDVKTYLHGIRGQYGNARRTIPIMIGRGCPFNCVFCSSNVIWKRKARFFSVDYIINHVKFLIKKYKVDGIPFQDEEFLIKHDFAHELLDGFISSGISKEIVWSCEARVDSVNRDLVRKQKKAGCVLIRFGMESGSQKILDFLKRSTTTVEQNKKAAELCKSEGLGCFGSFIIGSPMETVDDIVETINFIETNMIGHTVAMFVAVPYPGTDLYRICESEKLFREGITWYDFMIEEGDKVSTPVIRSKRFTSKQLADMRKYMNINVVEPINSRKKIKKLNHHKEINKILVGDDHMIRYPYYHGLSFFLEGVRHPREALNYSRKYLRKRKTIKMLKNL